MLICGCRAGTRPSVRVKVEQLPNFAGTLLCFLFVDGLTLHPVCLEQHRSDDFSGFSVGHIWFSGVASPSHSIRSRSRSNFFPSDSLLTDRMNVSLCCCFFFSDASSTRRLSVSPLMLQAGLVASFSLSSFMNDPPPSLFTPSSALSGASGAHALQPSPWQPPFDGRRADFSTAARLTLQRTLTATTLQRPS